MSENPIGLLGLGVGNPSAEIRLPPAGAAMPAVFLRLFRLRLGPLKVLFVAIDLDSISYVVTVRQYRLRIASLPSRTRNRDSPFSIYSVTFDSNSLQRDRNRDSPFSSTRENRTVLSPVRPQLLAKGRNRDRPFSNSARNRDSPLSISCSGFDSKEN
jgi:hypothetical protein